MTKKEMIKKYTELADYYADREKEYPHNKNLQRFYKRSKEMANEFIQDLEKLNGEAVKSKESCPYCESKSIMYAYPEGWECANCDQTWTT